jgi:2-polyprenyl-6-methoxyphenol hydroxylase-like FAD-dependent oxidoreductase
MVGMSLSIMLAAQGIRTIAFERHASTAIHPRAALFLSRTIEIFRSFGMMKTILEESEKYCIYE